MNSQLDFFKPVADEPEDDEVRKPVALNADQRTKLADELAKRFNQFVSISSGVDYVIAKIGQQYVELNQRGQDWVIPEKSVGIAPFKVEGKIIHALVD